MKLTEAQGLVERLREADARWQQQCDGWVARIRETDPSTMTEEFEARLRQSDDREAADRIEALEAIVRAVAEQGRITSGGIRRPAKYIQIPGEVFCAARAALTEAKQ